MSFITPVCNGARHLMDTVVSIEGQQYAPLEILVIDDGSTDTYGLHYGVHAGNMTRGLSPITTASSVPPPCT